MYIYTYISYIYIIYHTYIHIHTYIIYIIHIYVIYICDWFTKFFNFRILMSIFINKLRNSLTQLLPQ